MDPLYACANGVESFRAVLSLFNGCQLEKGNVTKMFFLEFVNFQSEECSFRQSSSFKTNFIFNLTTLDLVKSILG